MYNIPHPFEIQQPRTHLRMKLNRNINNPLPNLIFCH